MRETRNIHKILVAKVKEDSFADLEVDGRIILKLILKKQDIRM